MRIKEKNMGFNDHCYDIPLENKVKKCKYCGEYYTCEKLEQVPGFRDIDEEVCPYCIKTTSLSDVEDIKFVSNINTHCDFLIYNKLTSHR